RAADLVVVPEATTLGDVTAFGGVNRVEVTDAFAVFRILTVGDVDDVADNNGRGDDFVACLRPHGIFRIGVELPELFAGPGVVAADPAVALAVDGLHHATNGGHRWCGPLSVQDLVAGGGVFPEQFARHAVEC